MPSWLFLSTVIVIYGQLVEAGFGAKVNVSSAESSTSFEELYDDSSEESVTTTDDGVIVEKAILAAEITPKASYNLVDPPKEQPQNSVGSSNSPIKGQEDFLEYSSHAGSTDSSGFGNRFVPLPGNSKEANKIPSNGFNEDGRYQAMFQVAPTGWSLLGFNPKEHANHGSLTPQIPNNLPVPLSPSFNSPYGGLKHSNPKQLGHGDGNNQGWRPYNPSSGNSYSAGGFNSISQVEAVKSQLGRIKTAQEYASKTTVPQDSPSLKFNPYNGVRGSYLPPPRSRQPFASKIVGRSEAPGVGGPQPWNPIYNPPRTLPQTLQINSPEDPRWRDSSSQTWLYPGSSYVGPLARPMVLPSGFLADTYEVLMARIAHLQAVMNAIREASYWRGPTPSQRWK